MRSEAGEHGYARPVEGLVVVVDLDAMEVVEVADHGVVELPTRPGNYDPARVADPENIPHFPAPRADLKPIEITQPEGASFTVYGHGVAWQKWHVRIGFTPREGLVLHELGYDASGRSSTARRWRRCTSPTATRRRRTASRTSSTRASTASAGSPTR